MFWKDINKEFEKGIDKVDKLGYNKVYLLGILTNKYEFGKTKLNFVICKDESYQRMIEEKGFNKEKLIFTMGTLLIRK